MNTPTAFVNYKWLTLTFQLNPLCWMIGASIAQESLLIAIGPFVMAITVAREK